MCGKLVALAALTTLAIAPHGMAQEWIRNATNGHYYALTGSAMNWTAAQAQAEAWGGYLVTINDANENAWLKTTFSDVEGASLWTGGNDKAQEGRWVWVENDANFWNGASGGTVVPGMYANWASGEPNDSGGEDSCELRTDGKWNDNKHTQTRKGIVEATGLINPVGGKVQVGDTFTLYCQNRWPTGAETFQWYYGTSIDFGAASEISGATGCAYSIVNAQFSNEGYYWCEVTESGYTFLSDPAPVAVVPAGSFPVAGPIGLGMLICGAAIAGVRAVRRR